MATHGNILKNNFINALRATLGNVKQAAETCGIDRTTHYKWLKDDPEYKAMVDDLAEEDIDFVESQLRKRINGYDAKETKAFVIRGKIETVDILKHYPPDVTAIMYFLNNKGTARGYRNIQTIINKKGDPMDELPDEDLDKVIDQFKGELETRSQEYTSEPENYDLQQPGASGSDSQQIDENDIK